MVQFYPLSGVKLHHFSFILQPIWRDFGTRQRKKLRTFAARKLLFSKLTLNN